MNSSVYKKVMVVAFGIVGYCILNYVIEKLWILYAIFSVLAMMVAGRIFRAFENKISIYKIISAVVLAGLVILVYVEARWDIYNILNVLAKGDGFGAIVAFVVLGSAAVVMMYSTYTVIAAIASGMTLKEAGKITF